MPPHICWNRGLIALGAMLLLGAGGSRLAAEEPVPVPIERVRVADAGLRAAFDEGVLRSPTLKRLVDGLQCSDVIVHVSPRPAQDTFGGDLHLVAAGGGVRYVRIRVRQDLPRSRLIAMIAHELQHAVEVAAAPEVVDEASLVGLYHAIGYRVGTRQHETSDALRVGEQVLRDLIKTRPSFD